MPATRTATKPARFARVLTVLSSGERLVQVEERGPRSRKLTHYYVGAMPADFGRAFRFEKFGVEGGEVYETNIGDAEGRDASCCCLGHLRHGHKTVCRHVAAARALVGAGKLA